MMKRITFMAVAFAACLPLSAQQTAVPAPAAQAAPVPAPAPAAKSATPAAVPAAPKFQPLFATNLNPAKYEDPAKAAQLIKQREQMILLMIQKRQEIIRKDRKAKELHQQILDLQKELGVLLENKRDIIELTAQLSALDREIEHLELKKPVAVPAEKQGNAITAPAAPAK